MIDFLSFARLSKAAIGEISLARLFTEDELRLIDDALSSYQHNSAYSTVRAKVAALVAEDQRDRVVVIPLPKIRHP